MKRQSLLLSSSLALLDCVAPLNRPCGFAPLRGSWRAANLSLATGLLTMLICTPGWSAPPLAQPNSVMLTGARDSRQVVLTVNRSGRPSDATHQAQWASRNPKVAVVRAGRVVPVGDGKTQIVAKVGSEQVLIPVVVKASRKRSPVDFHRELIPVLTKQGCAGGSCHGSPQGKGGFSLSLFGYDPSIDRISLTRDASQRRINPVEPEKSLLLRKPSLNVPHVGGRRLRPADAAFPVLRNWIAEGARADGNPVACVRIEITPSEGRFLSAPGRSQQIAVKATFADGSVRDVTRIASYESSSPGVAEVDAGGKVVGKARGLAAISVRYLQYLESLPVTVLAPVPKFVWKPVPEFNGIDRLVNQRLRQLKVTASPTCDDATFLRRVHLDLTGLLPDPDVSRRFLSDKTADKRSRLVDTLLESDAFARYWALKKADLMRVTPQRMPDGRAELLAGWLFDTWKRNTPWDQLARELLTSSGETRKNPPSNFLLAVETPDERTEMSSQIFLGSRIQCAKCHNHPYENWTMNDYYRIAASFARTTTDGYSVVDTDRGETVHPVRKEKMHPWGAVPGVEPARRRVAFADWLVRPENPLFAKVEANRIWSELMGRGIVEPVDDFRSSNPPSNGPLLDALTKRFVASGFNRKDLIRWICNSQTYQRCAATDRFNATDDTLFSHARVRLLTAEQLQDALGKTAGTLDTLDDNRRTLSLLDTRIVDRRRERSREDAERVDQWRKQLQALPWVAGGWSICGPDAVDHAVMPEAMDPRWEALDLPEGKEKRLSLNGPIRWTLRRTLEAKEAARLVLEIEPRDHVEVYVDGKRIDRLRDNRWSLAVDAGAHELRLVLRLRHANQNLRFSFVGGGNAGLPGQVVTAITEGSDKAHPAIQGHLDAADDGMRRLLEERERRAKWSDYATQRPWSAPSLFLTAFGQPKRETACACERSGAPTLLQALELLNGEDTYRRLREGTPRLAALPDKEVIETLTLRAFGRLPNRAERDIAAGHLSKGKRRDDAILDLAWALVTTREFLFQH